MISIKDEADLVCEALVREMGRASRWQSVSEAWHALLHVRGMAKRLTEEEPWATAEGCATQPGPTTAELVRKYGKKVPDQESQ